MNALLRLMEVVRREVVRGLADADLANEKNIFVMIGVNIALYYSLI
jgi:hypothetical protein